MLHTKVIIDIRSVNLMRLTFLLLSELCHSGLRYYRYIKEGGHKNITDLFS